MPSKKSLDGKDADLLERFNNERKVERNSRRAMALRGVERKREVRA